MPAKDSRLVVEIDGDVTRVSFLERNILDEALIQRIGDEISQTIDPTANPKLLISFKGVEHLSSAALGMLININNKIRKKGGQLRLAHIDPQIYEVFTITKLNKLFQIHDDTQQAQSSFR